MLWQWQGGAKRGAKRGWGCCESAVGQPSSECCHFGAVACCFKPGNEVVVTVVDNVDSIDGKRTGYSLVGCRLCNGIDSGGTEVNREHPLHTFFSKVRYSLSGGTPTFGGAVNLRGCFGACGGCLEGGVSGGSNLGCQHLKEAQGPSSWFNTQPSISSKRPCTFPSLNAHLTTPLFLHPIGSKPPSSLLQTMGKIVVVQILKTRWCWHHTQHANII